MPAMAVHAHNIVSAACTSSSRFIASSALKHSLRLLLNQLLMLGESTRRNYHSRMRSTCSSLSLGSPKLIVQKCCIPFIEGGGECERHQDGTLTLTQVVAGAGLLLPGRTEDAQLVITQLEAPATQRQTKRAVVGSLVLLASRHRCCPSSAVAQSQSTTTVKGRSHESTGGLKTNHVQARCRVSLSVRFENLEYTSRY